MTSSCSRALLQRKSRAAASGSSSTAAPSTSLVARMRVRESGRASRKSWVRWPYSRTTSRWPTKRAPTLDEEDGGHLEQLEQAALLGGGLLRQEHEHQQEPEEQVEEEPRAPVLAPLLEEEGPAHVSSDRRA